jgi:hypothetical protein
MDLKTRPGGTAAAAASKPSLAAPLHSSANGLVSNALKEFLWLISDVHRGRVLDLGPVWQSTIDFLIERDFRMSFEDLLRSWKEFISTEEEQLRRAPVGEGGERVSQAKLAEKFLAGALQYPDDAFCGVLVWDLFDYFDSELIPRVIDRLFTILHPGGAVLALFHGRPPERFHRYRILDELNIELLPGPTLAIHARVFQNREILDMFGKFRSSKTFVGRDRLREGLFLK